MNAAVSAFDRVYPRASGGKTLAASIARLDRADAIYFLQRASNNATLATLAFDAGDIWRATMFQRAAAYFAAEARRDGFGAISEPRPANGRGRPSNGLGEAMP
jgi:hypothetical protein